MKFGQISIKKKLTIILVAISLISVLITTTTLTLIGIFNLKQNIQRELDVSARIVGERNRAAIAFDTVESSNLDVFSSQPAILRACLYNAEGGLFAQYGKDDNCPEVAEQIVENEEYFHSNQDIFHANSSEKVGSIFVESDKRNIKRYIDSQIFMTLIVVSATVLVSLLLALLLQRTISRPILQLADLAGQISSNRDFTVRANLSESESAKNEISTLYRAFNTMLTEIDAREQQLLQTNEELYKAKVTAENASRAKSEFLANVSHELRTPLNAIIGFSSIIMNQLFGLIGNDKYMEYAKDINESGIHLLDIINDILDLSKAEAGKLTLTFEEVNVAKAIRKCVTLLSERAHEQQVLISTQIPEELPPLVADNLRFIQIVLNILSNAVKFTEPGGKVGIAVETAVTENEVTDFIITIKDSGIGMSPEEIEKAFQSFGQIDSGLNRKYEGTGLGLPLTKKLVDLHHGTIEVQSEKGKGTSVKLHFLANPVYVSELIEVAEVNQKYA